MPRTNTPVSKGNYVYPNEVRKNVETCFGCGASVTGTQEAYCRFCGKWHLLCKQCTRNCVDEGTGMATLCAASVDVRVALTLMDERKAT